MWVCDFSAVGQGMAWRGGLCMYVCMYVGES